MGEEKRMMVNYIEMLSEHEDSIMKWTVEY
jgi:hypothetical protein